MTQLLPITYLLDTTGISSNNKIIDETHILQQNKIRALVPIYGPFYKDGLVITDTDTNLPLQNTDYKFYSIQSLASAMYGKEIYNAILITNQAISNNIKITYQTLGGEYSRNYTSIKDLLQRVYSDNRPYNWSSIENQPTEYNPSLHLHAIGDTIGFEYLVAALERLTNTIATGSSLAADQMLSYLDTKLASLKAINTTLELDMQSLIDASTSIISHMADYNNPHEVDKIQVGLSELFNYAPATSVDISNPNINNPKYVTNISLKEYLTNYFATYQIETAEQISVLQEQTFLATQKANEAVQAVASISDLINKANTLETNYNNIQVMFNSATANLESSRLNAELMIQQYITNGN
jgi:hypothetical protein